MATLAARLGRIARKGHVFGVRDNLQVIRVPAGVDAAAVVQFHAVRYRAA
jgi:hypothetical protein